MNNYNQDPFSDYTVVGSQVKPASRSFMANVFLWMFGALAISAITSFLFATIPAFSDMIRTPDGHATGLGMLFFFAPIIFVFAIGLGFARMSAGTLTAIFLIYAAVMGISLSSILLVYAASSVLGCFLSASAMFGIMAVMGYTTDKDLTSMGRLLMMGVIGIAVAMLINMFLGSEQMDYIISILGVIIFTGLTAYDVQKLKRVGAGIEYDVNPNDIRKISILGALTLYLDFINLFLFLIRIFGGGRRRN
jgi:uncharacterized protein